MYDNNLVIKQSLSYLLGKRILRDKFHEKQNFQRLKEFVPT